MRQAGHQRGRAGLPGGRRVPEVGGGGTAQRRPERIGPVPEREEPGRSARPRHPPVPAVLEDARLAASRLPVPRSPRYPAWRYPIVPPAPRPQWQQATALITVGAGSIATGLAFVPKAAADLTTPASIPPVTLLALEHANAPAPGRDAMLRAAIVHIARHFLRLAETRSPAEMEAMIWQYASTDGANHGPSCAAFASLTLELGSHIAGLDSWVNGGTSYPWPVHSWVDSRVDPNA